MNSEFRQTSNSRARLDALRCTHCRRLLGRIHAAPGTTVEIKCSKCATINRVHFSNRDPETTANSDHVIDS